MKTSTRPRSRSRVLTRAVARVLAAALLTTVASGALFGVVPAQADVGPWASATKSQRTSDMQKVAQTIWNFDANHPAAPYSPERFRHEVYDADIPRSWTSRDDFYTKDPLYEFGANQAGFCIAARSPRLEEDVVTDSRAAFLIYDSTTKTVSQPSEAVWQGTSAAFDPCAIWTRQIATVIGLGGVWGEQDPLLTFVTDDPNYKGPLNNQNSDYSLPDYIVSKGGTVPSVDAAPSGAKVWPLPKAAQAWTCDAYCQWVEKASGYDPRTNTKVGTGDKAVNFQYSQYQMMAAESDAVAHYISTHPSGGQATWLTTTQRAYAKTVTKAAWTKATKKVYAKQSRAYKRSHSLAKYRKVHTLVKFRRTNTLAQYRQAHPYKGEVVQPTLSQVAKDPAVAYYADNLPTGKYAAYYPTLVAWAPASWLKAHPSVTAAKAYCIVGNTLGTGLVSPQAIWVSGLDRDQEVVPGIGDQPTDASDPCSAVTVDTSTLTPKSDTGIADPTTNLPVGYQPAA